MSSEATQGNEISIYKGSLNPSCVIANVSKIEKAFPSLPTEFYQVFAERIKANGFCDTRLNDAVNSVIDNCVYPSPTLAQFLSFDKKFKVYNYEEMVKKWIELGQDIRKSYNAVKIVGRKKPVWAHIDDIQKYNLNKF